MNNSTCIIVRCVYIYALLSLVGLSDESQTKEVFCGTGSIGWRKGRYTNRYRPVHLTAEVLQFMLTLELSTSKVYCVFVCVFQGNLYEFLRLTGWRGSKVLYFGDHIYSDLAVSTNKHRKVSFSAYFFLSKED